MHVTGGSGRRVEQITNELRDGYHIEGLEEVRVIRDRQTSKTPRLLLQHTWVGCPDVLQNCRASWAFSDSETSIIRAHSLSATFHPSSCTVQVPAGMAVVPRFALHIAGRERTVLVLELKAIGLVKT
jgi:hypothetical protein